MVDQKPATKTRPGLWARVKAAGNALWTPSDVGFGPGEPIRPQAPTEPIRREDYNIARNIQFVPRSAEGRAVTYDQMRNLTRTYGILRTVIEKRKDEIKGLDWAIAPRAEYSQVDAFQQIKDVTRFFEKPDGEHTFDQWVGMFLEDLFVLDAPTIFRRKDRGGRLMALDIVDGATILVLVNDKGRVPAPPKPAYEQVIKGFPRTWWTKDELLYQPYNLASDGVYGWSHVESIIFTINIALRRDTSFLEYFRSGNIPQGLIQAPETWTPEQVIQGQEAFDTLLAGDLAQRSKIHLVPGAGSPVQMLQQLTFDALFDEWLARIVCARFGVSPAPYVRMMERACYSMDTETLTENGWKKYDDIGNTEKIATYNPQTEKVEYHLPAKRYCYPYTGEMVHFQTSAGVDVMVTPEHKMWLRQESAYYKSEAKDMPSSQFRFLASSGWNGEVCPWFKLNGNFIKMDDWLEFLGYFLSEGGLSYKKDGCLNPRNYKVNIAQKEGLKADKIKACLTRLPFNFGTRTDKNGCVRFDIYNKELCEWLHKNTGGRGQEKYIPRQFMKLCESLLRILLEALMLGDGTKDSRLNRTSRQYYSTSPKLSDDVQELAFKLGYSVKLTSHEDKRTNTRRRIYRVLICERKEYSLRPTASERTPCSIIREDNPTNSVYCFEVPNHLFVTRRNGCIGIHGNTAETVEEAAKEEGVVPLMDHIKSILDLIIQEDLQQPTLEWTWTSGQLHYRIDDSRINSQMLHDGCMNINDVRKQKGLPKIEGGDTYLVWAGATPTKLDDILSGKFAQSQQQGIFGQSGQGLLTQGNILPGYENFELSIEPDAPQAEPKGDLTEAYTLSLKAIKEEMDDWEHFALNRLGKKSVRDFEFACIPLATAVQIRNGLSEAKDAKAVKAVFDTARQNIGRTRTPSVRQDLDSLMADYASELKKVAESAKIQATTSVKAGEPFPRAFLPQWSNDIIKVYSVDGDTVRSRFDKTFTEGGHDQVYGVMNDRLIEKKIQPYIGPGEIWLEEAFKRTWPLIMLHEITERNLMKGGIKYNPAHEEADRIEDDAQAKNDPVLTEKLIQEQLVKAA